MEPTRVQELEISKLIESPFNPRKHYDPNQLNELAETVREKGIIQPILARNVKGNGSFEIVFGHRRYRAAKIAGLPTVPTIVADLSDQEALSRMIIENDQREDVNVLEQAQSYQDAMKHQSLDMLSRTIGKSPRWIYDRVKLLKLTKEVKELLSNGKITAGHAILLARLDPEQQRKAVASGNYDVWKAEHTLFTPGDLREYDNVKFCSVRELESWIDQHVRFEKKSPDPMLFPETVEVLKQSAQVSEKVIQITHDFVVHPDAKQGNKERIYSNRTWKRADGQKWFDPVRYKTVKGSTCDRSVVGVIVAGADRGAAYKVCVDKNCAVHWPKPKQTAAASKKEKSDAASKTYWERQNERWERERKKSQEMHDKWDAAKQSVREACAAKIKGAKYGVLSQMIHGSELSQHGQLKMAADFVGKPKTMEDLVRLVCMWAIIEESERYDACFRFPKRAKQLNVDAKKIMDSQDNSEQPAVQTSAKKNRRPKNKKRK